jgi:tetratricopeptide (TPR) repeat protein
MDALKAEQDSLQVQEYRDGPIHPSLAPILADLATIDRYLGRYADAESALKWALAIREKAFGPGDPLVAQSRHQLASLYLDWGHWEEAEFYEKKALSALENNLSRDSIFNAWLPDFIRFIKSLTPKQAARQQTQNPAGKNFFSPWQAYSLMGQIELGLQRNKEALSFFQKSLEAEQKDPDRTPSEHIHNLDLMAETCTLLQQPSDAQSCLEEALNTAKTHFKPNSIEVADSSERLGGFYHSQNLAEKAKPLLASAREIYRGCVGTYFGYDSIPYVQKLAKADETQGQFIEAQDLLQKNLQSVREAFGADHPRVAVGLLDLAGAEENLGQDADAQKNLKQALKIAQSFYRDDYPLVLKIKKQIHP